MNTRRQFLITAPLGLVTAAACRGTTPSPAETATPAQATPGAPVAFGTSPAVGPEVTAATFTEAEKLIQVSYTDADRAMLVASWRRSMAPMFERRTGPRKVALPDTLAPGMIWHPAAAIGAAPPPADRFAGSTEDAGPLPSADADIAFAPLTSLARWIERRLKVPH